MPKIDQLFAFLAFDDSGEGVIGYRVDGSMMPLIGADRTRIDSLRVYAQRIADAGRRPVTLAIFDRRRDLETILPKP